MFIFYSIAWQITSKNARTFWIFKLKQYLCPNKQTVDPQMFQMFSKTHNIVQMILTFFRYLRLVMFVPVLQILLLKFINRNHLMFCLFHIKPRGTYLLIIYRLLFYLRSHCSLLVIDSYGFFGGAGTCFFFYISLSRWLIQTRPPIFGANTWSR